MRLHMLYIEECNSIIWATRDYFETDTLKAPMSDLEMVCNSTVLPLTAKKTINRYEYKDVQRYYSWHINRVRAKRGSTTLDSTYWRWVTGESTSPHKEWESRLVKSLYRSCNMPNGNPLPPDDVLMGVHKDVERIRLFQVMEQPKISLAFPSPSELGAWIGHISKCVKTEGTADEHDS